MSRGTQATQSSEVPLVIVNGLGAPLAAAELYGSVFRRAGFAKVSVAPQRLFGYGDVRKSARLLEGHVEKVLRQTGAEKVDLVGMSLGGLISLYYVKCMGGAPHVRRFVSVGGPLNGSSVAHLAAAIPSDFVHAVGQLRPDTMMLQEIARAPRPEGVRIYSVGTKGDFLTPRSSYDIPDAEEVIETPYGCAPIGHWMLFSDPRNQRVVIDLLQRP